MKKFKRHKKRKIKKKNKRFKHLITKRKKRKKEEIWTTHNTSTKRKNKKKEVPTITPDEFALVVERRADSLEAVTLAVPTLVPRLLVDVHRACSVEPVAELGDVALGLGLATQEALGAQLRAEARRVIVCGRRGKGGISCVSSFVSVYLSVYMHLHVQLILFIRK